MSASHSFSKQSSSSASRAKFLSSSATTFLATVCGILTASALDPSDPDTCVAHAAAMTTKTNNNNNPRYIDQELQMNYGDTNHPRYRGVLVRRFTGDNTPYSFPIRPIKLLKEWPPGDPPFTAQDFDRVDPSPDAQFYTLPKLVYHIDEPAVAALTQYYRQSIPAGSEILDICSSWVSHYPLEFPKTMKRICATGMNALELQFNDQVTGGYTTTDLNVNPKLPYPDESFDVVTCVVSIDYLIHPIQVLQEVHRVLRPGGKVIISQSNRCFPTKAIAMWLNMNDRQHLELINGFFQYAGGYEEPRQAFDITATLPDNGYRDPMFIVQATKKL